MEYSSRRDAERDGRPQVLWAEDERVFCRTWRKAGNGDPGSVLIVMPASEHPTPSYLDRLTHEYGLRDALDATWAVRPLALESESAVVHCCLRILAANRWSECSVRP